MITGPLVKCEIALGEGAQQRRALDRALAVGTGGEVDLAADLPRRPSAMGDPYDARRGE